MQLFAEQRNYIYPELPTQYALLEYLSANLDRTTWIDTGIIWTQNHSIEIKEFRTAGNGDSVFGVNPLVAITNTSTTRRIRYNSNVIDGKGGLVSDLHTTKLNKNLLYIDGVLEYTFTPGTFTSNYTAILFGRRVNSDSSVEELGAATVYYCKIWDNDTLVRDYIPVKNTLTNELGMYDLVGKRFYGNDGTGTFIAGPEINAVEYIESNGTQYIDTGILGNEINKCEVKATFTQSLTESSVLFGGGSGAATSRYFGVTSVLQTFFSNGGTAAIGSKKTIGVFNTYLYEFSNTEMSLTVDDIREITHSLNSTATNASYKLFCVGNATMYFAYSKAKYFKLYNNDILVRNYIPIKLTQNSTTEYAMFDTVTSTVYRNAGTGTFTGGNVVYKQKLRVGYSEAVSNDYERLEYIESSGTQYIDTNYLSTNVGKIEVDAHPTTTARALFGVRSKGSSADAVQCWLTSIVSVRIDGTYADSTIPSTGRINVILDVVNKESYINGTKYSLNYSGSIWSANIYLFTRNMSSSSEIQSSIMSGNIYHAKLWDKNGTLVRDFIPVHKKSTNKNGMYDLVNGVFYPSATATDFIAGPTKASTRIAYTNKLIHLPTGFEACNYIQSSGTQYINTNVIPTSQYGYYLDCNICSDNNNDNIVMGTRENGGDTRFWVDMDWTTTDALGFGYGTYSDNNHRWPMTGKAGQRIEIELNYNNNGSGKIDGVETDPLSSHIWASTPITKPVYIFAGNASGTVNYYTSTKMYRVKITNGTTLVRDFVPCKNLSTNKYGMYDIITKTFYGNNGIGDFIGG